MGGSDRSGSIPFNCLTLGKGSTCAQIEKNENVSYSVKSDSLLPCGL